MYLSMILNLFLVLGLFLVLTFILYKMNKRKSKSTPDLAVLSSLSVGAKEKVVIIKAGSEHILVGVTQHQISLLSKINRIDQSQEDSQLFSEYLDAAKIDGTKTVNENI